MKEYVGLHTHIHFKVIGEKMIGRSAQVEILEFDHVCVDGQIYRTRPYSEGLVQIVPYGKEPFDDFDLQIQCEEVYHEFLIGRELKQS